MKLHWSSSYKRAFKQTVNVRPDTKQKIITVMEKLSVDPFSAELKTYKLKGILENSWACAAGYNLRIIFNFVKNVETSETEILLTHVTQK
ncbi:MAG: type II toxin-antitoxin system mRNA interferase toxin, RelE/StbE family [Ignavibacteria bacterium CG_4_8_14_3_um_filter_37_9]|nr:MAG: type II toxin-antitoxin system mRNA interferase toxin, RelE/StbE family [Ignavibacteria bacterium CG_4_8_14_3_um_filter_37_9]